MVEDDFRAATSSMVRRPGLQVGDEGAFLMPGNKVAVFSSFEIVQGGDSMRAKSTIYRAFEH